MASKCQKCGNTENYNFALNVGLCDICIGKELKRIEELEDVIQAVLRISDLWTLKEVETMLEDEAKSLELMKQGFEKALKGK